MSGRLLLSALALALVWMIRGSLESGLNIHLLGTMLVTLVYGWRIGIVVMAMVCSLASAWGNIPVQNLGLTILLHAIGGVSFCYLFFLVVEARLHRHLFIYLYVSAFLGSALNYVLMGTVSCVLLAMAGIYSWDLLRSEFLPYYYLMSFSEAFLSCGLLTLAVVYRPDWVYSFRDERYLSR